MMTARASNNQSPEGAHAGAMDRRRASEDRPGFLIPTANLHIVAIPLIILSTLAVGFLLVYLKEILVPFVVAMFFVYLLRPMVDVLTRPCADCCHESCIDSSYTDTIKKDASSVKGKSSRRSRPNPIARAKSSEAQARVRWELEDPLSVTFCRVCTFTRCPRWIAVLIALSVAFGVLSSLVLLVADAIQSLEGDELKMYHDSAYQIADKTLEWINLLFHVDGSSLLKSLKTQVPVAELVQRLFVIMIDAVGNTFLILLLVLYLLSEQSTPAAGSLKRKIDDQIQRYIGIKTLVSAGLGLLIYIVLGPMLKISLAHIVGVLSFFLNFIPSVGAVIATAIPLPLIILDLRLSTSTKLLAIALPTAIHLVVGNLVEPKLFGRSLELHPVIVLLALAFWFSIWGVVGAILSIPVTAVLRIVLSHVNHPYAKVIIRLLEGHIGLADIEVLQHIGATEYTADDEAEADEEAGAVRSTVSGAESDSGAVAGAVQVRPGAQLQQSTSPFSEPDTDDDSAALVVVSPGLGRGKK